MVTPALPDQPGPLLASGGSAHIHAWGAEHVLKLYFAGVPAELPAAEAVRTNAARAAGAPAPLAVETVRVAGRNGVVFERITGPTMLEALLARPDTLGTLAGRLAAMQAALHGLAGDGLPPLGKRVRERIEHCSALPVTLRAQLAELPDRLPPGTALCHGDFHPGNVILAGRGPVIIDWYDATSGPPDADFACTLLRLRYASVPGGAGPAVEQVRAAFHDAYEKAYRALRPVDSASLEAWTVIMATARLAEAPTRVERDRLAEAIARRLRTA